MKVFEMKDNHGIAAREADFQLAQFLLLGRVITDDDDRSSGSGGSPLIMRFGRGRR